MVSWVSDSGLVSSIRSKGGNIVRRGRIEPSFAVIAVAAFLLIVYGSLYPFEFAAQPNRAGPFPALLASMRHMPHRGDVIANILLYIPLGYFAIQALRQRPRVSDLLLLTLGGLAMSAAIECAQYYDAGRETSAWDVCNNTLGTFLGAVAGTMLHRRIDLPLTVRLRQRPYVVLLLACWLGYRLFPYVPVIDLHAYWGAVKPVLLARQVPLPDLYRHVAIWLSLALLLEALTGGAWPRLTFIFMVGLVESGRIVMGTRLSPAEVLGGAIAVLLWTALLARLNVRSGIVALLFTLMVILQGLEPFQLIWPARHFQWVPFYGFLHGSATVNVMSFLEKAFTYGALVWLGVRAGLSFRVATSVGAMLVFSLRLCQVYLPDRSAEITDAIILLAMAGLLKLLREDAAAHGRA